MNEMNVESEATVSSANLKPHRGTMILVFGILSIVCCAVFGIIAWVMGNGDLKQMDEGTMDPDGRQLTQAGKICGIIGVALQALGILLYLFIFVLAIGGSAVAN